MNAFRRKSPGDNDELRRALYAGDLFLLEPSRASKELVEQAQADVDEIFADLDSPRQVHAELDEVAFFERVGALRRKVFSDPVYRRLIEDLTGELGFDPAQVAFDPMKIRAIRHDGHLVEAAAPVYYAHRDTWYGHPQALITWWIPLDDLDDDETFVFYPERFDKEVPNDSEIFDYDDWVRGGQGLRIGWQDRDASKKETYPAMGGEVETGEVLEFSCRRGEQLLFSGSHLHQTREQTTGRTRFSLDFRIVHLGDVAAGRGAPNVDNRSRGSALVDYERLIPA
jgi:hypothetical protein